MSHKPVQELYHGMMLNNAIGIGIDKGYTGFGWLMAKHPDGQWVTIAKLPEPYVSAPDLLEALKLCWEQLSLYVANDDEQSPEDKEALDKACTVITKAENK